MRKIFLFMMVSVDGYFEGENHDLSWHNVDEEFNEFAIQQLDEADTLVFGRRTYEMMASYWPQEDVIEEDPEVAKRMNGMNKIVFSRSLTSSDWHNTQVYADNVKEVLTQLKNQDGKDIAVLGSSNLCITLLKENLLDELRIMVNPVVVGKGTTLFEGIEERLKLKLTKSHELKSGNVLNYYSPIY